MSDRTARIVVSVVIAVIVLLLAWSVFAQPSRESALDQYVRDVKDHRDWLESQLAAAKANITALQAQLAACGNQSAPRVLPRADP